MVAPLTTAGIGVDIGGTSTRVALIDCGELVPAPCGTGILPVSPQATDSRGTLSSRAFAGFVSRAAGFSLRDPPAFEALHRTVDPACLIEKCSTRFPSVLADRSWRTRETRTLDELLDRIAHAIVELTTNQPKFRDDGSIGLAIPGTLNEARDRVVRCVNVPFLEDSVIAKTLGERVGHPVALCTDAEAATWAEYLHVARTSLQQFPFSCSEPRASARAIPADSTKRDVGMRRDAGTWPRRFVHLRIGTGVACGVVIDGGLVRLDDDRRTHPPFLVVDDTTEAAECRCGLRGCLESIASGRALEASARNLGLGGGMSVLETAWRRSLGAATPSDAPTLSAIEIVRRAAEAIGVAIGLVADRFRAEVVCLGGGVLANAPCLMEGAIHAYQRSVVTGASTGEAYRLPAPLLYKKGLGEVLSGSKPPPESPLGKGGAKETDCARDGTQASPVSVFRAAGFSPRDISCIGERSPAEEPAHEDGKLSNVSRARAIVMVAHLGDEAGVIGAALLGTRAAYPAK